jgi:hypothetical protein
MHILRFEEKVVNGSLQRFVFGTLGETGHAAPVQLWQDVLNTGLHFELVVFAGQPLAYEHGTESPRKRRKKLK